MNKQIEGFSKLDKSNKIDWLINNHFKSQSKIKDLLLSYWNSDKEVQKNHDEFSENTISNFYYPLGVAPNFLINNKIFTLPMVTEESSVVAAACKAAKFWLSRGGFHTKIINTEKIGQIHFLFKGNPSNIKYFFNKNKSKLIDSIKEITKKMNKRGGGLKKIEIIDKTNLIDNYYQLKATFETVDAMGANFINSCLEKLSKSLVNYIKEGSDLPSSEKNIEIIMSILSNYTPNCLVHASVSCPIKNLGPFEKLSAEEFAKKFILAIKIAENDHYRAVTHNKGIMNGIDSLAMATGNDFRAIEACAHAFASRSGKYKSLSNAFIKNNYFNFEIELPLSLGNYWRFNSTSPSC